MSRKIKQQEPAEIPERAIPVPFSEVHGVWYCYVEVDQIWVEVIKLPLMEDPSSEEPKPVNAIIVGGEGPLQGRLIHICENTCVMAEIVYVDRIEDR